jgi:cellulose synthase/poly-beta-1,6-N-acetylglucosamine synthase-like glycosyltransferase
MTSKASVLLSVVIIGRNEGERLSRCLESVRAMVLGDTPYEIIYVDSGSIDSSLRRAKDLGARVISLEGKHHTAARGRNAGWRVARGEYVLFLDGDTQLDPDFVRNALPSFADPTVAVVWGHRRETAVGASLFNRVLDLDWLYRPGLTEFCGGDALMRRSVLENVAGYDDSLIAGEEPEMCCRIRQAGGVILHLDLAMTGHDLAMTRWSQYWKRAQRAGHAYAQMAQRSQATDLPLWTEEARRNLLHSGMVIGSGLIAALLAVLAAWNPLMLLAFFWIIMVSRTVWRQRWKSSDKTTLLLYGIHSHLQQLPITWGQLSYGHQVKTGRQRGLIEYK